MPSAIEILPVDPFDTAAHDAWWGAYAAARRTDMGADALIWTLEESRAEMQQRSATTERRAFIARRGGAVVGSGSLALGLKDNLHSASIAVTVPPEHRRTGVGSALLAHIEAKARAAGRRTFRAETTWPASAPADGGGQPGREFARRHGYDVALGDLQNRLDLPVTETVVDALLAEAPADGYELHSWIGPVPEQFVAEWAALDAALDTEAPTGDLDVEAYSAEVEDHRADEAMQAAQNRTSFGTIAVASDGRVAAYTQIVVSGDDGNAYQWGTLVRREDRGHRLGLRIKLENLRMLQRHAPEVPRIYTYNAESNEHMLAVNVRLGFAPIARMAELQKKLG
ncbi:GNAT family N-acetyltransferase [Microbacterium sp. NPDC058342]|uniref:GNAT family N-acetyltransferase n=1 Tax=Microbacterium sp. NPDC058342 TaxID=3346454 RepID=UPI00364A7AD0